MALRSDANRTPRVRGAVMSDKPRRLLLTSGSESASRRRVRRCLEPQCTRAYQPSCDRLLQAQRLSAGKPLVQLALLFVTLAQTLDECRVAAASLDVLVDRGTYSVGHVLVVGTSNELERGRLLILQPQRHRLGHGGSPLGVRVLFKVSLLTTFVNLSGHILDYSLTILISSHRDVLEVPMERIELGDFLLIAELHTGIDAHQLARLPRVVQLGSSALAAPFAGFGDYELYPTLGEKAAIYCARIVSYHPLPDGNKRTGYDVMREFIARNGATFSHPPEGLAATASAIEDLAAGVTGETDFIAGCSAGLTEALGLRRAHRYAAAARSIRQAS
jgi:death on curing protein